MSDGLSRVLATILRLLIFPPQAQKPAKIPKIGFLAAVPLPVQAHQTECLSIRDAP